MAAQKTFSILYTFADRQNVVQASVNASQTLLGFVLKDMLTPAESSAGDENPKPSTPSMVYKPFVVEVNNTSASEKEPLSLLTMPRTKQVMVQFLWRKQSTFEKLYQDKFLLFIHTECEFRI